MTDEDTTGETPIADEAGPEKPGEKVIDPSAPLKPLFQQSFETQAAIACLEDVAVGGLVKYLVLSEAMGVVAQAGGQASIRSARRYLERESDMVFGVIRGVGLKRLNDIEIIGTGAEGLAKSRRAARRAGRRMTCVVFEKLARPDQIRQQAYRSLFNAMDALGKATSVRKLEATVTKTQRVLPLNATLEAFKK